MHLSPGVPPAASEAGTNVASDGFPWLPRCGEKEPERQGSREGVGLAGSQPKFHF